MVFEKQYFAESFIMLMVLGGLILMVYENNRMDRKIKRQLYITYVVIMIATISEAAAVALNGAPGTTRNIHAIVKMMDYLFTPAAGLMFILQVKLTDKLENAMVVVLIVNLLLQVSSLFTGWTFYLDAENYYHHGPFYWVYMGVYLVVIMMVLVEFFRFGKQFSKENKGSLISIITIVMTGIALQEVCSVRTACLGLICGSVLMFIHYGEFIQLNSDASLVRQRELLEKDAMTGLFSRYYYDELLERYGKSSTGSAEIIAFSIDLNGLKKTNDSMGHSFGDDMIKGAAVCINGVLSPYGKCFRVGGDEFAALLYTDKQQAEELAQNLHRQATAWSVLNSMELSLSIGWVSNKDYPNLTLEHLMDIADENMYEEKKCYYQHADHDRRQRRPSEANGKAENAD